MGTERRFDVVVVGAGVAGLVVALDLVDRRPDLTIAIVDKGSTGSTPLAQGGMAAAIGSNDTPALHAEDTQIAGDGLANPDAVHALAYEAPARVHDLIRRRTQLDTNPDGTLHLAREGGQSVPRSVHQADATGAAIFAALLTAARTTSRITRVVGSACEIAVTQEATRRATGVWVLGTEGLELLRAHEVVLATGGCGGLYASTTNTDGATADGVAIAYRAGAALIDMEFVQFHPTGLKAEGSGAQRVLLTESLRGAGAVLIDAAGTRFMTDRHPDAELAPRHVVAKGILDTGEVWLDASMLGADRLAEAFPTVTTHSRDRGHDLAAGPVPVEPVQHYMIGGVATDVWGASSLAGLSAVGEVASTGVHGANRMAGNSLAQACVFGHRVAIRLASTITATPQATTPDQPTFAISDTDPDLLRTLLRTTMADGAGAVRSQNSMEETATAIADLRKRAGTAPSADTASLALHHAAEVAALITASALRREESRGVHWREDFPTHRNIWDGVRMRVQRGFSRSA